MNRPGRRLLVAAALVAAGPLLLAAAPAAAQLKAPPVYNSGLPEKMSGDEIKATWFDGAPMIAVAPDGKQYRMVFSPDGKATRTPVEGKKPKTVSGFWRVIAEGYCSRWTGNNREKCFNVRKSADGSETVVRFGGQIAATWKRR
ncbi:MAG: hypothetical protein GX458_21135 [Phyllobacteriaceae bacterium]|nr:hypothetical protein [Phyllobacteriaceae bacterium]